MLAPLQQTFAGNPSQAPHEWNSNNVIDTDTDVGPVELFRIEQPTH
jgi:hypothetical protein